MCPITCGDLIDKQNTASSIRYGTRIDGAVYFSMTVVPEDTSYVLRHYLGWNIIDVFPPVLFNRFGEIH